MMEQKTEDLIRQQQIEDFKRLRGNLADLKVVNPAHIHNSGDDRLTRWIGSALCVACATLFDTLGEALDHFDDLGFACSYANRSIGG